MTRNFFAKVMISGGYLTRRYLYMIETSNDVRRIVRYRRDAQGNAWLTPDNAYVCAVYSA